VNSLKKILLGILFFSWQKNTYIFFWNRSGSVQFQIMNQVRFGRKQP